MSYRGARVVVLVLAPLLLALCPATLFAQPAPRQLFFVCTAQAPPSAPGSLATFYFSGVLQGPATAMQTFRTDFAQFLMQRYSFKGAAACAVANALPNAQNVLNQRATALKANTRVSVVETGWTESVDASAPAVPAAAARVPAARGAPTPAAAPAARAGAANAATPRNAAAGAGAGPSGRGDGQATSSAGGKTDTATEVASVIGAIFGSNAGGGASSGANGSNGTSAGGSRGQKAAGRGTEAPGSQLSNTIASAFNSASNTGSRGAQPRAAANAPNGLPGGALGSAQTATTKLVVYGCGRQGEQIACVSDLTNQNARESLVQSAEVWKDAFLVDDRGDRHMRSNGFFLNIDGEQRQQLDISMGKSAKFVLMFDSVQQRVQKVALRAPSGGLDVEDISLISADAAGNASSTPQR